MKRHYVLLILFLSLFLACSKDDNPNPPEGPVDSLHGFFVDSPVSGLKYETETHSGITDENGTYDYEEGETVTFYVGAIKLGSAPASEELSPISIASIPNATIDTPEVQNIAAFLQTLDEDGDPENGITINPEIVNAISLSEIDFSAPVIQVLGEIVIEIFQNTGISLKVVYPERAAMHLASTLGVEFEPLDYFNFNFLPAFTNYFSVDYYSLYIPGASIQLHWVHEFDTEGNLVKSTAYEKYPFRILSEYHFSNYDAEGLSIDVSKNIYNYHNRWTVYESENYTLKLDQDYLIKEVIPGEGAILTKRKVIEEYSSENLVTASAVYRDDGQLILRANYVYDANDNLLEIRISPPDDIQKLSKEFTYTDVGEVKTISHYLNDNETRKYEYFYRDDKTLERYNYEFSNGMTTYSFSDAENLEELMTQYDDGEKNIFIYTEEELIEQFFWDGTNLGDVFYYKFNGEGYDNMAYKWEWYEDGILRERHVLNDNYDYISFEYFYDNGNVEYKDFYDEDGNEIYREYYDEEGNLLNTEYYN